MSRSRSPTPVRSYYQSRQSRSTSPVKVSKEDQLKKIAKFSINLISRNRWQDNFFGDEKEFWPYVNTQKRNDKNFDLEKAKTWWLNFNQPLPSTDMVKNIIWNLITSMNTFNQIEKKCIDIVCKENMEEDIPDNWDDTMLRCTITANINDFEKLNILTVSHYFITNRNIMTNHHPGVQLQSYLWTTTQSLSFIHARKKKWKRKAIIWSTQDLKVRIDPQEHQCSSVDISMTKIEKNQQMMNYRQRFKPSNKISTMQTKTCK
jgi:hypothetical protein